MASQGGPSRKSIASSYSSAHGRRKSVENVGGVERKSYPASFKKSMGTSGERTVRRLRLVKALTVPENTNIFDACRRMAARRVDALLLTDSNALLCGILTAEDIALRVVAQEVNLQETPVAKVMTKNPVFALSDTLASEALQKMVQGKFRHLPVVENGEVVALLDISKCLYDAISRLERAVEKGKAIAAAVEGVENSWGSTLSGNNTFIETLREKMFKPSLSTLITDNSKPVIVSPTETVLAVTKKMLERKSGCAVIVSDNKLRGILTSKDILMRIVAPNLPPASTIVEKVMTANPECANVDTPVLDALHTMHDRKFLHLPVLNKDGNITAVVDAIHINHAAVTTISQVGTATGLSNENPSAMMQNFFDSAMDLGANEDEDSRSDESQKLASDETEAGRSFQFPESAMQHVFTFKIDDKKGRMHRFNCETRHMTDLITALLARLGNDIDRYNLPEILYEDEDKDKVLLNSDNDLITAVEHARSSGLKSLRLHLEHSGTCVSFAQNAAWSSAYKAVAAGAVLMVGLAVLTLLRRSASSPFKQF